MNRRDILKGAALLPAFALIPASLAENTPVNLRKTLRDGAQSWFESKPVYGLEHKLTEWTHLMISVKDGVKTCYINGVETKLDLQAPVLFDPDFDRFTIDPNPCEQIAGVTAWDRPLNKMQSAEINKAWQNLF